MRRQLQGLSRSGTRSDISDGVYLVRVQRAHYRWHKLKPFYELSFYVLQPETFVGGAITARLYCSPKLLWKFAWFLRDFRYSQELLERDEIDARALIGLLGVLQISHEIVSGRSMVKLEAFAAQADWEHLAANPARPGVAVWSTATAGSISTSPARVGTATPTWRDGGRRIRALI